MKKMILALAVVLMTAGAAWAQLPCAGQQYENYIQVTGKAEKEIVPDQIYIRIVINENDNKGKVSLEAQERNMISKLKSLGIDTEKNLKVGDMSSDFQQFWLRKNAVRTTATYQLLVTSAQKMAEVFQALESIDISNLSVTKITHSKLQELTNEVRIEAMKNAQQIAQSLAEAVGQKAGRAIYIADYNNDILNTANNVMLARTKSTMMDAEAGSMPEEQLEFRNIKLKYSVSAKFALE